MLSVFKHYLHSNTIHLKNFFKPAPAKKTMTMPQFQVTFFIEQAIKQHKLVQVNLQLKDQKTEILTGQLLSGPNSKTILMRQAKTTRIIFLEQITYISAITPTVIHNNLAIKTCS